MLRQPPHDQVHIEEVPESQSGHTESDQPSGLACPDPDKMIRDDQIFIRFMDTWLEDIKATQTISQKLTEASGDNHSTRFKDIVPKPYQEFQDVFTKEVFDELLNRKQWDHTIKLIPDA